MVRVSIVKCESYDSEKVFSAVSESLRLIGFDIATIKPGSKILLKPNMLGAWPPEKAVTTHLAVFEAVCRVFSGFRLFVGDSCGAMGGDGGTLRAMKASGVADVAKKYNARFLDFDADKRSNIEKAENVVLKSVAVAESVRKMDFIINLPKLKTHMLTGYTGAIKNFFGMLPGKSKTRCHSLGRKLDDFNNILVDIYSAVPPNLTIMDGIVGMDGLGPSAGKPRHTGIIAASTNGAALDSVLSERIGFRKGEIGTVDAARKRGLFDEVDVAGFTDFKIKYKKPYTYRFTWLASLSSGFYALITPTLSADRSKCISCGACIKACPQGAVSFSGRFPYFDKKKCILCYCCMEVCPQHAVILKKPFVTLRK